MCQKVSEVCRGGNVECVTWGSSTARRVITSHHGCFPHHANPRLAGKTAIHFVFYHSLFYERREKPIFLRQALGPVLTSR